MMTMPLLWLAWLAGLLLFGIFAGSTPLRVLLLLLPWFLGFAIITARLVARGVTVRLFMQEIGAKQRGVRGEISVQSRSPLPLALLRCRLRIVNRLTGEQTRQTVLISLQRKTTRRAPLMLKSPHCGRISIALERAEVIDFFGISRHRVRTALEAGATVLPNTFAVRLLPIHDIFSPQEAEEYDPNRRGRDVSEVFQIREYRPGDSIKQVHWKLTGKYDQLMVKEAARPMKRSLLLLVDLRSAEGEEFSAACRDATAEVGVSIAQALLELGIVHTVAWPEDDLLPRRLVRTVEDLTELFSNLLTSEQNVQKQLMQEQYEELFQSPDFSRIIMVTLSPPASLPKGDERLTALCCDPTGQNKKRQPGLYTFGAKTYARDVSELII